MKNYLKLTAVGSLALMLFCGCGVIKEALDDDEDEETCFVGDKQVSCDSEDGETVDVKEISTHMSRLIAANVQAVYGINTFLFSTENTQTAMEMQSKNAALAIEVLLKAINQVELSSAALAPNPPTEDAFIAATFGANLSLTAEFTPAEIELILASGPTHRPILTLMARLGVEAKEAKRMLDDAMNEIRKESYDAAKSAAVKLRIAETIKETAGLALGVGTTILTAGAATPAVAAGITAGKMVGKVAAVVTNVDAVLKIGVASGKLVTELFTSTKVQTSDTSAFEQSALVTSIDKSTKFINFIDYSKFITKPKEEALAQQVVYVSNAFIEAAEGLFKFDGSKPDKLKIVEMFGGPITLEGFGIGDFQSTILPASDSDTKNVIPSWVKGSLDLLKPVEKLKVFGGVLDLPGSNSPPTTGSGTGWYGSCQIKNANGYDACMEYEGATDMNSLNTACAPMNGTPVATKCASGVGSCTVTNAGTVTRVYYLGKYSEAEARQHCSGSAGGGGSAVFSK